MKPPRPTEIEVSLFGPGVGESVVAHIGNGEWMVVDSCRDRRSSVPVALDYLRSLGIDVTSAVRFLVATHAHSDHLAGFASMVAECEAAEVVVSQALTTEEFVALTQLEQTPFHLRPFVFGEYSEALRVLRERHGGRARLRYAIQNRPLYTRTSGVSARIIALSPSDEAVTRAIEHFSGYFPTAGQVPRQVRTQDPNEWTVALWVTVGRRNVILGGDLTKGPGPACGWNAVVADDQTPDDDAEVFKVPHHGAPNAHHGGVWSDLLIEDPVAILAPFRAGRTPRPSDEDVQRICGLAGEAYLSSTKETPQQPASIKRDQRKLRSIASNIGRAAGEAGQSRLRAESTSNDNWSVELLSHAMPLC